MKNLKLVSDFREWYDHMFDSDGISFYRPSKYLGRKESLKFMELAGLRVPKYGGIMDHWDKGNNVVVHADEYAHRGDGKHIVDTFNFPSPKDLDCYDGMTCVEYLVDDTSFGMSKRYLFIGNRAFTLTYQSNEWRSNCGDVQIFSNGERFGMSRPPAFDSIFPLLALDTITVKGKEYYIDMNTSPGIPKDIGLTATEVVESIKEFVFQ